MHQDFLGSTTGTHNVLNIITGGTYLKSSTYLCKHRIVSYRPSSCYGCTVTVQPQTIEYERVKSVMICANKSRQRVLYFSRTTAFVLWMKKNKRRKRRRKRKNNDIGEEK